MLGCLAIDSRVSHGPVVVSRCYRLAVAVIDIELRGGRTTHTVRDRDRDRDHDHDSDRADAGRRTHFPGFSLPCVSSLLVAHSCSSASASASNSNVDLDFDFHVHFDFNFNFRRLTTDD